MNQRQFFRAALAAFILAANAAANIVYVNSGATGANDGSSWASAFVDLQDALDAAQPGQEIWVAGGPYVPGRNRFGQPTSGPDATFYIGAAAADVKIFGGFLGNEVSRWKRNAFVYATRLDGQGLIYHVVTMENVDQTTQFDGFVVTGGQAFGDGFDDQVGAGLTGTDSSPIIANCTFVDNAAQQSGGGAYVSGSTPKFINCRFIDNTCGDGDISGIGGGLVAGYDAKIIDSLFVGNIAEGLGAAGHAAAVHSDGEAPTYISGCTFVDNGSAALNGSGGGLHISGDADIYGSIFWGNQAQFDPQISVEDPNQPVAVGTCDVEGGYGGSNILDADPLFVDRPGRNFRLQSNSPLLYLGESDRLFADYADLDANGDVDEPTPLDLELTQRFLDEYFHLGCFQAFDCQANGIGDSVEIAAGLAQDCNGNGIPDGCEIAQCDGSPGCADCNGNGILDSCDIANCTDSPECADCNGNGVPDGCDIDTAQPGDFELYDCNNNRIPDGCEFGDCNGNEILDVCEGASGRLYVRQGLKSLPDGASWETAYGTIGQALCVAAAQPERRFEVWVAEGTYYAAIPRGVDREWTFNLLDNVELVGGFIGEETDRSQRDVAGNPTVLSGDFFGNDGAVEGDPRSENAYHVVTAANVGRGAVLDGFFVVGGNADGGDGFGGGLLVRNASPTITNCIFVGNTALSGGGAIDIGGVETITPGDGGPEISNCRFLGCDAATGAAIRATGGSLTFVVNTIFSGNGYQSAGAAVALEGSAILGALNCTVAANGHGGFTAQPGTTLSIANTIIWNSGLPAISGPATVRYSLVQGGFAGPGNIDADPLLGVDFALSAGSPALDAGDNAAVSTILGDIQGQTRVQQCRVDMGARESALFADCDGDGAGDACAIAANAALDCDGDGRLDRCQPNFSDCDSNGVSDACESDSDGDGIIDACDGCPNDAAKSSPGACGCGAADVDTDGDGVPDCIDNCPSRANPDQADGDRNGAGDACDSLIRIDCPGDITIAAANADGATVPFTLPTAVSAFGAATVTSTVQPGDRLPVGRTDVLITATDEAGGVATCTFAINVLPPDESGRPSDEEECPDLYKINGGALQFFGIPIGCGPGCLITVPLMLIGLSGVKIRRRRRR